MKKIIKKSIGTLMFLLLLGFLLCIAGYSLKESFIVIGVTTFMVFWIVVAVCLLGE